jgi:general secretion pathway protein E
MGKFTDWITSLQSESSTDSASEPRSNSEQGDAEAQDMHGRVNTDFREPEGIDLDDLRKEAEAAPVIRMVNLIVSEAVEQGASHIHVEPTKTGLLIRQRVDGLLRKSMDLPKWVQGAVISRIKIMANMDTAEKRLPQDGRIGVRVGGRTFDLRVSMIPASYGEDVNIQILDSANATIPLETLGLSTAVLGKMGDIIAKLQGILLITGPAGSGKTTTLYGILNRINFGEVKVITVEDPIECELAGITQVAVQEKIGLTFAVILRSIVRQDPDVIVVGEIRDRETAEIAIQLALSGHMVLSTLNTDDATGAVTRLLEMGVEEKLLPSCLKGVLAQRLVRKICEGCSGQREIPEALREEVEQETGSFPEGELRIGRGCEACGGTGYRGRTGIFELLTVTEGIKHLIRSRADSGAIRAKAIADGMRLLREDGWEKVRRGVITIEEVLRVTRTG